MPRQKKEKQLKSYRAKYPPRLILLIVARSYLNGEQFESLKDDLVQGAISDRKFVLKLKKHLDIERLKDQPHTWQDIWIYNCLFR